MKISIGTNIKEGPWGGGNLFAINLRNYLIKQGHNVVHNLKDDDIDIILITEPRKTSESSAFTHIEVLNYLSYVKSDTLVVHRFNECDERKNTNYVNKYLINANKVADHTIFVSDWLRQLYVNQGLMRENLDVIYAGADENIFNSNNLIKWDSVGPIKLVTHHWGANWNKGFDFYLILDELVGKAEWKNKLEFTYIGNIPQKANFKNSSIIKPLSGALLADEIKKNHIYITGSINEPSGNHHIEASQCGLPVLYINSGGIPEYCNNYGIMFNNKEDFEEKLLNLIENYSTFSKKLESYPFSASKMSLDYLNLFERMYENKEVYFKSRDIEYKKSFFGKKIFNYKRKKINY
tara:strand:+ start:104 stop:1153 length:1050 start_codon:yes stop_codon:yes gene_type:complete